MPGSDWCPSFLTGNIVFTLFRFCLLQVPSNDPWPLEKNQYRKLLLIRQFCIPGMVSKRRKSWITKTKTVSLLNEIWTCQTENVQHSTTSSTYKLTIQYYYDLIVTESFACVMIWYLRLESLINAPGLSLGKDWCCSLKSLDWYRDKIQPSIFEGHQTRQFEGTMIN